jgi:hypothetical protein
MRSPKNTPSAVRSFGAALFDHGLRVREEYNELILNQRDFELRVHVSELADSNSLRCSISVPSQRIAAGTLVLFNEIALEGYPVVAFGAGQRQVTFEFAWFHPTGADWRISAERCQGLVDRVVGAFAVSSAEQAVRPSHAMIAPQRVVKRRSLAAA